MMTPKNGRLNIQLKGSRLNYNVSQQIRYKKKIDDLVGKMKRETERELKKLFSGELADDFFTQQKEAAAMDAGIATKAKQLMNKLQKSFQQLFSLEAPDLAKNMVEEQKESSARSLNASLKRLSGGLTIRGDIIPKGLNEIISASISENVALIKSIPQKYVSDVTGSVMRSITSGEGINELLPAIKKHGAITDRRAKMIAYDQTRKAYNVINKARMQAVGAKQFEWVHSGGGQHPRKSHIAMSGKIFSFDDLPQINKDNPGEPPQYGIPGQAPNCGCTMVPVITFGEEE